MEIDFQFALPDQLNAENIELKKRDGELKLPKLTLLCS